MISLICLYLLSSAYASPRASLRDTPVDFTNPRVKGHIESLARIGASCVIKTKPLPSDVRAYLTNSPAISHRGKCFVTCMLESSNVMHRREVNTEMLIKLAGLINGKNSRVVQNLKYVSKECLRIVSPDVYKDHCEFGSKYNDCLNEKMREFKFPEEIAEEVLRVMPFHRLLTDH